MKLPPTLIIIWKASNIYVFWIGIHFITANMYPYFCADVSLYGVVTSPFLVMAPHCKALLWGQQTSTMAIENMWFVLGTWLCSQMLPNPEIIAQSPTSRS